MYEYEAEVVRVIDGDTVRFKVDLGFHMTAELNFRLLGIDTPEIRGEERPEGLKVKAAVEDLLLNQAETVRIVTTKPDKYGRWLATVYIKLTRSFSATSHTEWLDVNQWLLDNGLAKPYGK